MNDLKDYAIRATDGDIGRVKDCYFDDESWVVRYLVVDTGSWLMSRKVLISPISIGEANWADKVLSVSVTREQVKSSPDVDTSRPVSRQHEQQYLSYYGYPGYWGGMGMWGMGSNPGPLAGVTDGAQVRQGAKEDVHLRSGNSVEGYHIMAADGDIGHVDNLLVEEDTWAVRYLIVKTSNWWGGHQVLIAPKWIRDVSWSRSAVTVDLDREAVKNSPPYDATAQLERKHEIDVHLHYRRPGYWPESSDRSARS